MVEYKREIILDEGVPVEVLDYTGTLHHTTTALIGKATKQFFTEIALEHHRSGQFVPELTITNGLIVKNIVLDTDYLIMATFDELLGGEKSATIARMVQTNTSMTVSLYDEVADDNGNVKRELVPVVEDLSVYLEAVDAKLEQYKPGLHAEVIYKVYAPLIDVEVLDNISLKINGKDAPFKVISTDYTSFQGVLILEVRTETRK